MSREQKEEIKRIISPERVFFGEPMAKHSTMGVGGNAECFAVVNSLEELKALLNFTSERGVEYRFWGNGSNVLVRDKGVRGIIARLGEKFDFVEELRRDGDDVHVSVGAATSTQKLVRWAAAEGLMGMEGLAGIPGTIGGNLATNAGTEAGAIGDVVDELTVVTKEGRELSMKRQALRFEYRSLKIPGTSALVRAVLKLKKSSAEEISARVEEAMKRRRKNQPVGEMSLGCIFKNSGKTSAGLLIDEAGLKNVRIGGARVSNVHANFIVNEGKATARDITVLIGLIREKVREQTGISLETEIEIIGDE